MGSGGVAIAALPTVICLKVPFSDGLGGVYGCIPARGKYFLQDITIYEASCILCHLAVCQLLIMNANLADSAVNPC